MMVRLLIDAKFSGSLIGKGGHIINQLRIVSPCECGCGDVDAYAYAHVDVDVDETFALL